jgi:hypothetical protein
MKKLVACLLIAGFMMLSPGVVNANAKLLQGAFMDIQGHWAESEINQVYSQGLMQGVGVDEFGFKVFAPDENVNRFQLAVVLERAFELDYGNMCFIKEPVAGDYYYDVEEEAWYSEAVVLGAINHIFDWQNEFQGLEEVTRIEVARSIYNAFHAKGISVPMIMLMPVYDDTADLSQEEVNAMVFVSNTGIMKGDNNLFRPYDRITRAELARVLNQAVKLIEMNPVQADPVPTAKLESREVKSESPLINIDLSIPVVTGLQNKEVESKINQLLEKEALERQQAMIEEANKNSDYILTEPYHTYELVSRFYQYYVSEDVLSFYVDYYSYTGGAHGMTERLAYNFDLKTGKDLALSDFFAPGSGYIEMINEKIQAEIDRNPNDYFTGELGFKGISEDQGFYLENGNLVVFFLQYEIAPYAAGIRTFSIPIAIGYKQQLSAEETAVVQLVKDFGEKLKNVSLLAPEDVVKASIQENYGNYVAPALLEKWQEDLVNVPGRVTSSPWPERIDVTKVQKISDSRYDIQATIIEMTGVEMAGGGIAGQRTVTLTVEKYEDRWLISGYQENQAIVYKNTQYGFSFILPESWQGYSIITGEWEGNAPSDQGVNTVETGPQISIRHPEWTAENPRQDIPILVLTHSQWDSIQAGEFNIGAAPIGPSLLGRNAKYVFALPARYNYAFPAGYEEVEMILQNNPLQAIE